MVLTEVIQYEGQDWAELSYSATWNYDYELMLLLAQEIINEDFKDNLDKVSYSSDPNKAEAEITEEIKKCDNILEKSEVLKEKPATISISGISNILKTEIQFSFYSQTRLVKAFIKGKNNEIKKDNHYLEDYLNSIEIRAHCKRTEKKILRDLNYEI